MTPAPAHPSGGSSAPRSGPHHHRCCTHGARLQVREELHAHELFCSLPSTTRRHGYTCPLAGAHPVPLTSHHPAPLPTPPTRCCSPLKTRARRAPCSRTRLDGRARADVAPTGKEPEPERRRPVAASARPLVSVPVCHWHHTTSRPSRGGCAFNVVPYILSYARRGHVMRGTVRGALRVVRARCVCVRSSRMALG